MDGKSCWEEQSEQGGWVVRKGATRVKKLQQKMGCLLCSYCEDGFMHCTTSGAPGSLLPDIVLSSPFSHRSEYCSSERLFSSLLSRLLPMGGGRELAVLSDVCRYSNRGLALPHNPLTPSSV